jgi:hypothetical protein
MTTPMAEVAKNFATLPARPGSASPSVDREERVMEATRVLDLVDGAMAAVAEADDEQLLQDYMAEMMKRLGAGATLARTQRIPPPGAAAPDAASRLAVQRPAAGAVPAARPAPVAARAERTPERPPERVEQLSAMRNLANEYVHGQLNDFARGRALRRLRRCSILAFAAGLCVVGFLAMSAYGAPQAYYAAWGAHLIAVAATFGFLFSGTRLRGDRRPSDTSDVPTERRKS